jgi:RNA 2',3'-cyclic 3'-phosphodiesterase
MRLFIGIPPAAAVIDELSATLRRLQSNADGLRWSAPESWHITLQFLGNADQEQCDCAVARLRELHASSVPISIEGLNFSDRAGVFFAAIRPARELLLLQKHITAATKLCGFIPEARPYQPHITLARSKGRQQKQPALLAKIPRQPHFTRYTAGEFLLYESFLGPAGSRYEVRERFPLAKPSGISRV